MIDLQGDSRGVFSGIQTFEGIDETVCDLCGVFGGRRGENRRGGTGESGAGVVERGGGGEVVDGDRSVHERGSGDEVFAGFLVGGEEGVGGLAGSDDDGVDAEGLCVGGVDFDDGEVVAGDLEEELFIECSVDDP